MQCYRKNISSFLTLDELGRVLKILSSSHSGNVCISCTYVILTIILFSALFQQKRTFNFKLLKTGTPNLLIVPPGKQRNSTGML